MFLALPKLGAVDVVGELYGAPVHDTEGSAFGLGTCGHREDAYSVVDE